MSVSEFVGRHGGEFVQSMAIERNLFFPTTRFFRTFTGNAVVNPSYHTISHQSVVPPNPHWHRELVTNEGMFVSTGGTTLGSSTLHTLPNQGVDAFFRCYVHFRGVFQGCSILPEGPLVVHEENIDDINWGWAIGLFVTSGDLQGSLHPFRSFFAPDYFAAGGPEYDDRDLSSFGTPIVLNQGSSGGFPVAYNRIVVFSVSAVGGSIVVSPMGPAWPAGGFNNFLNLYQGGSGGEGVVFNLSEIGTLTRQQHTLLPLNSELINPKSLYPPFGPMVTSSIVEPLNFYEAKFLGMRPEGSPSPVEIYDV